MKKFDMNKIRSMATMAMLTVTALTIPVGATTANSFDAVVTPIVSLINNMMNPILAIVGAVGALYCVLLGVKYAKAEEPQEREKAKGNLKGAVIGFVLIFVLLVALKLAMPVLQQWVYDSTAPTTSVS